MAREFRSEKNAVSTGDLNLTRYPNAIDSYDNNTNMKGFINLGENPAGTNPDIVYAEHINALLDAVMSIQRTLGIKPQGAFADVVSRLNKVDVHNHDSRYGGAGWIASQTLTGHTHNGAAGHPSRINLDTEVQGTLEKTNLNLTSSGLTGADLRMSSGVATKISDAVNDKLSTSEGGTVKAELIVEGPFSNRLMREWSAADAAGTSITDNGAMGNQAKRYSGTSSAYFINRTEKNLQYGKYVIGVRLKTSSQASESVAFIRLRNKHSNTSIANQTKIINGNHFDALHTWQMFYFVVDVNGDKADSYPIIQIGKDVTNNSMSIDFDHAFIMPVHPAIFDR